MITQLRTSFAGRREPRETLIQLGHSWGWFALFGVVCIGAGLIALAWPRPTLLMLAVVFGAALVMSGIFRLVEAVALHDASAGARSVLAILGLLGLVIGLYALRHVEITVVALGLVLGIFWVIDGIGLIFAAIEHPGLPGRGWTALSGAVGVVAGIILLAWPEVSALVLSIIVGISLVLFGALQFAIASQLWRLSRYVPREASG